MTAADANTYWVKIYIAGPLEVAKQVCRKECLREGLCVTIEPTTYIYTGGEEAGVVVGLINYPRFPRPDDETLRRAIVLADNLMDAMCQHSVLVMTPHKTFWKTIRPQ